MPKNTSQTTTNQNTSQQGNSSFNNQIQYGQIHPETNQYIDAYANWRPEMDPNIGFRGATARNRLNKIYNNPTGGYVTPQMRDRLIASGNRDIDQQSAIEGRQGQFDVNQQRGGQLGSIASLMSPRIVSTGSSGTGQSSQTGTMSGTQNTEAGKNLFGNLLDVGMGAASMIMS